jgi:DNA-binding NarL/FixJ family response regulator
MKRKVFLIGEHSIFLEWMRIAINSEPDLTVCAVAFATSRAMKRINEMKPDVAIVDLPFLDKKDMEFVTGLKGECRELPVLAVSTHEELIYAERILLAGADGYLTKYETAETLKTAIRKLLDGNIYLGDKMVALLLSKLMRNRQAESTSFTLNKLSNREFDVFRLIGQGKMTRHISGELGVKKATINTFRFRIMDKLGFKNSDELVWHANRWVREHI